MAATSERLSIQVIRGEVLGVTVYRGFASLADLARVSQADVYDQESNPIGTQRDLNPRHAREAYDYVRTRAFRFFPEIVLNARESSILRFRAITAGSDLGVLTIDTGRMQQLLKRRAVVISRLDGNHRLFYADGHNPNLPPIEDEVGFCLIYGLKGATNESELTLFRDINANQKGMNTSHLDSVALRLAGSNLASRDPLLFIAERLMSDTRSPFYGLVYRGGSKTDAAVQVIPLRSLKTSVQYTKSQSRHLGKLGPDGQAALIMRYWQAVKRWVPEAWKEPKKYIVIRSTGFWAMSFIGSAVIDHALTTGEVTASAMLKTLRSGRQWDWTTAGDFRGFGGRAGATEIATAVTGEFAVGALSLAEIEKNLTHS